jgi:hypothetical protein
MARLTAVVALLVPSNLAAVAAKVETPDYNRNVA